MAKPLDRPRYQEEKRKNGREVKPRKGGRGKPLKEIHGSPTSRLVPEILVGRRDGRRGTAKFLGVFALCKILPRRYLNRCLSRIGDDEGARDRNGLLEADFI
jgi:hypothetical protein